MDCADLLPTGDYGDTDSDARASGCRAKGPEVRFCLSPQKNSLKQKFKGCFSYFSKSFSWGAAKPGAAKFFVKQYRVKYTSAPANAI